jgi:hypothetical protein
MAKDVMTELDLKSSTHATLLHDKIALGAPYDTESRI